MLLTEIMLMSLLAGCAGNNINASDPYLSWSIAAADTSVGIAVVFSEHEIKIIRAYYESHSPGHDKGKHKNLPPGIAKNLARGKPLPPGIAKKALPPDLLGELPPPPRGYERIIVAGKVLLVEVATQIVHDVLTDIVFD